MTELCNNCKQEQAETSGLCSSCKGTLQTSRSATTLNEGTVMENRYKIINLIKSGRIKNIYKILDTKFNNILAMKEIILPEHVKDRQKTDGWFIRESHFLAGLSHPNMPKIFDHFIFNNKYYLVMSFIEGEDLNSIIKRDRLAPAPKEKIIDLVNQILNLMDYLYKEHSHIVQRVVTPENFIIHKDGRAILVDFGMASALHMNTALEEYNIPDDKKEIHLHEEEHCMVKVMKGIFPEGLASVKDLWNSLPFIQHINKLCRVLQDPFDRGPLGEETLLENRYKIIGLIKSGGMGALYRALDMRLESTCAVKELLPFYGRKEEQEEAKKWFKREAAILASLDHPNLPKVSDYFISNNRYYIVMDFIEGDNLKTIVDKTGEKGLEAEKVIKWSKDILKILDYLHTQNPPVIYRDIKPSNIMIHRDGRAILIDFGIARVIDRDSNTEKTVIGTEGYCPVEQYRGKVEARSDIYALGATMHHLLTGLPPVPFKFEPLREIIPEISPEVEEIVMKSLKEKPQDRFASAKDMLIALDALKETKENSTDAMKIYDIKGITCEHKINALKQRNSWSCCARGGILTCEGRYEEAIEAYDMALDIYIDNEIAWNSKGEALYMMGKYDEALECYDKAIGLKPDYDVAWNFKGEVLYKQGKYEEALNCFNEALKIDPAYKYAGRNRDELLKEMNVSK
ncbi:MAG: protein kinase [Candidatus Eremiobacterota bacterium]